VRRLAAAIIGGKPPHSMKNNEVYAAASRRTPWKISIERFQH